MKVRLTLIVELGCDHALDDEEEREALIASLTDKDEPSFIHSNYIGDTIGQVLTVESLEEVK